MPRFGPNWFWDQYSTDNSDNSEVGIDVRDNSDHSDNSHVWVNASDNSDNSDNSRVDIDASDDSDNSFNLDKEFHDSYNKAFQDSYNDNSVQNQDSFNVTGSFNTQTLYDYSTTAGVRQYETNAGDVNLGGLFGKAGLGGGGKTIIDQRSLQFDQSVNQAISTESGDVSQDFGQEANVAMGARAYAADSIDIDKSSVEYNIGDVNIGNTTVSTEISESFKSFNEEYDVDVSRSIDDSFNDQSTNTDLDLNLNDSFTNDTYSAEITDIDAAAWSNAGNVFSDGGEVFDIF